MICRATTLVFILGCLGRVSSKSLPEVTPQWIYNDNNEASMPDVINFKLNLGEETVTINLIRRLLEIENSSILTRVKDKISEWKFSKNEMLATYDDTTTGTFFTIGVKYVGDRKETFYMAKFSYGNNFYILSPEVFNMTDQTINSNVEVNRNTYFLVIDGTLHSIVEYMGSDPSEEKRIGFEYDEKMTVSKRAIDDKTLMTIEILVVVDYSVYQKFYLQTKASSEEERSHDAVVYIRYIFTHIFNLIKENFENLKMNGMKITSKVVQIYIAKNKEDSPYVENNKIDNSSINVPEAVNAFWDWASSKKFFFKFDVVAGFTSYKMVNQKRKKMYNGISYQNSMCGSSPKVLIRFADFFQAVRSSTHELGHSSGALHDVDENTCQNGAMSTYFADIATFTACSAEEIKNRMMELNESNKNCLIETQDSKVKNPLQDVYPGQIYNLDDQCKILYGTDHFFFEVKDSNNTVCETLTCFDNAHIKNFSRAMDGTTCSNGGWCLNRKCIFNNKAPKAADHCINGDNKDIFNYGNLKTTCKELINNDTDLCDDKSIKANCCASCTGKRIRGEGCQDTINECHKLKPKDCYNYYFSTTCCKTCKSLIQNPSNQDCLYGDKGDNCKNLVPDICHLHNPYCCQSCATFNGIPSI